VPLTRFRRAAIATPVVEAEAEATADDGGQAEMPNVPFGVFLAPAAVLMLLFGDRIITWYLARLGGPQ
jgi:prepilin signal peptidase PulO-like enzyme (type II secretory pathway)